jgi:smad nuclear-interacting protein 1
MTARGKAPTVIFYQPLGTKMVQESRSPPHRRPQHPDDRNEEYSGQHRSRGGFRGRDDRNDGEYGQRRVDNGWVDRNKDRRSDRNHGYSGRDDRRPEYDERERDRERNRGRERYGEGTRDRNRAGLSRRSASPSRLSRPRLLRSRSRSLSASRSTSAVDKSKPNFAPSGLLAAATNTVKAVDGSSTVLKYNEPPEARKPILGWRLYVFKGSEQVGTSLSPLGLDPVFIDIYIYMCQNCCIFTVRARISLDGTKQWLTYRLTIRRVQSNMLLFNVRY